MWKYTTTNFKEAWLKFRRSGEYLDFIQSMKKQGIVQPCSHNILHQVFSAGWRASGVKTKFVRPAKKK